MRQIAIILFALSRYAGAAEVDLKAIIADPQRFDGQKVTTRGLAEDAGNGLYLFPDFTTAAKSAFAGQRTAYLRGAFKLEDNRCWFAVTGIVRAHLHGPWGQNRCEIEITNIRKLYREKRLLWPEDFGVFRNATPTTVFVESELSDGGSTGTIISANQTGEVEINFRGVLTVKDWSASEFPKPIMFRAKVEIPSRKPQEPSERNFHFVIHKDRLEAADPSVRAIKIKEE